MNQFQALYEILTFTPQREQAIALYLEYYDEDFRFELTKDIIIIVLKKCINDVISVDDLEEWASFIDCRDEIINDKYEDYIYALSNPALMNPVDMRNKKEVTLSSLEIDKIKRMLACLTDG